MKGLKTNGMAELRKLRSRVIRQHGLTRISKPDRDKLIDYIDRIEAHIISMEELDNEEF